MLFFSFQKIFPTSETHEYHQFFEAPRYYNMLLDAWEIKQQEDRSVGKDFVYIVLVLKRVISSLHLSAIIQFVLIFKKSF